MARSRITRTFHNKPVEKSYKPKQSTSIKKVVHKQKYSPNKSTQSKGLIPQAHAQESAPIPVNPQGKYGTIDSTENQIHGEKWGSFGFTINKTGRPHGRNVKIRKSTRADGVADTTVTSKYTNLDTEKYTKEPTPLGLFARGVGNQAQDIGGGVHGLVTGQDYTTKSILSKATEHAFAGDWDSAGRVISDNPYRFAGNVATEAGLAIIPFGMVVRGAGIAGRVGSAASKVSKGLGKTKGKRKAIKAIKQEEKRIGRKFTKNERRNIMDDTPTVKDVQKKTLSEVAKGDTNYSYWSKASGKQNVHGKNWNQMTSKERVKERSLDLSYSNYVKKSDSGFSGNAFSRSNIGSNFPIERRFDTTIKTAKISKHNQAKYPDQAFLTWGESPILRRLGGYDVSTKPGTFAAARSSGTNIGKSSVSRKQLEELRKTGKTQNLGKGRKWVTSPFGVKYENI